MLIHFALQARRNLLGHVTRQTGINHEEVLFRLGRMRKVHHEAPSKARTQCCRRDHLDLASGLGVELQHCPGAFPQGQVQPVEETSQSLKGFLALLVTIAQPLQSRDGDRAIECARPELRSLAGVGQEDVAVDLALHRDAQHGRRDVVADPEVPGLGDGLAADAGPTSDVEQQARSVGQQAQLQSSLGHLRLNLNHSAARRILLRLGLVVENLRGILVLRPAHSGLSSVLPAD
mmetsp:Transcript_37974/g.96285  ORF Transcript_37974/g.96285 Transcript_37974/m.96285 type:complete len:233 (-) Transcript_37974:27-725(-)